ncbi:PTS system fructose-specific IIBC components [Tatumella ptyseos ATCC 33301]|mgnify:FL=1|uniref:protein-N(pi)-phosphohistidine--D-fructose phosphotransferase n=1 Tax=Tatumella ptyseos ATCC 33301 TaxID=1005995 RepID=A0A085JCT3_9GAMM|nr:fructose-specific PTS transporter subunit EIIC [Tatumella ptyseos]KFD18279.1 PTS system fructose-specific IIBC components [Tatumella ptyseos ATCC 33301]
MNERIIAVTACPTGVAHTFMAAEALKTAAAKRGFPFKAETRGSVGARDTFSDEDIHEADVVIIAADIETDLSRFHGKRLYRTSTSQALKKPEETLLEALRLATPYQNNTVDSQARGTELPAIYKHLMTGVSHMLPLVVAGGLCIALSFVFGINAFKQPGTLAAALMEIGGKAAFALMVPVLAGYIAYSIADRPGLAPGLIAGMLASASGAGFLGGIIAGFLAGYTARFLTRKITLPSSMEALKPVLVIPLLATVISGLVMIYVVGGPVSAVMRGLTHFLAGMTTANAVLLGVLLGAMQCFDLGGPVNKAAYTFGVGLLASQSYEPMAAIMAAGMVPALGMGIATWLAKSRFTPPELQAGKASFVLGLCFISEGAIPFAARDPMRVIPSTMAGGALAGGLSMYFGCTLMAPHGGLFVLAIPHAVGHVGMYLVAIIAGSLVTGGMYALLRRAPVQSAVPS